MITCIDYICAILVKILTLIFHFLPIRFTLWLGRQCGIIAYLVNANRRVIGYANLRAVFCGDKSPEELKKLTKGVYRNLTEVVFEILSLSKVNERYIDKYVEIVNAENLIRIADHPDGIIFLAAHFGNWELSGMVSSVKGFPIVVLAREQSMKRMNEFINKVRESKGLQVVRKGITTKYIVKALHQGRIIGMVGDQSAGKAGVFVDFFGRPVSTAPGTAKIASKTGALVLPAFMARVKGPYHKLIIEEPIKIGKEEDITPYLERCNKLLEKYITMHPEQWLWLHKRWKATPIKKVTVISDGKRGHLNQALALCREFKKYRGRSGYTFEDTHVETVEVKFKNRFTEMLLPFFGLFSSKGCQGCMRCLRFCLTRDSYENLMKRYSDVVISCGSGVAGVNRFFSLENNAKSAVVMKPSILGLNKFDMAVLPRHDRKNGTANGSVIVTDTVPNLIDEEYLKSASKKISEIVKLERPKKAPSRPNRRIGVLLGGDNSDFALTDDITKKLLENTVDASKKLDADLLFTTSRRTPKAAESAVKAGLGSEKRCKLLVIANEKNIPYAVGGILGLSDVIVVSGESASMISEAIQSGKLVIVFRLKKKKKKNSKFERMLRHLEEKGYIIIADAEELSGLICRNFHASKKERIPLQDSHNIYKYMWRLGA
ncbi:MAG: mitochondrial fission ELM1 family protein [Candidatus Omnitrophota bacterium]|nr:MAG: mitochondrial fission ELM1 family protein [Candidatus Omnitrophota bacterium]